MGSEKSTTLKATVHPTTKDIAWAAGFLEGEGYFGRSGGHGPYTSERICAGQRDRECLEKLLALFGGTIREQHQVTRNLVKSEGLASLCRTGAFLGRARGVMMTIYSFISNKRKSAIRKALAA